MLFTRETAASEISQVNQHLTIFEFAFEFEFESQLEDSTALTHNNSIRRCSIRRTASIPKLKRF